MAQSKLSVARRLPVDQLVEAELLDEAIELAVRSRSFVEIDEVRFDSPLGEEPKGLSCVRTLLDAKDLNFHRSEYTYRPAWWVPGGHAQTLWSKFFRRRVSLPLRLERWDTPDGDFVDIQRLDAGTGAPRLFFLHGLEGTTQSHYVAGFFAQAHSRGWGADLLIFRGCGSELNRTRRFYHSGETGDAAFALDRIMAEHPDSPIVLAGVSLGGNVLLKLLGEWGNESPRQVLGASAISVPFDLERGARRLSRGLSRIYDRHFLRTLRAKARRKLERFPGLFDANQLDRARTIFDFDDAVTAPVHGFTSAHDYYACSSALGWLERVRVPTFLLSAVNDPFLPAAVLDEVRDVARRNPKLELEFTEGGGHVGFVAGRWPWRPFYYAEWRVCEFLAERLDRGGGGSEARGSPDLRHRA